MIVKKYGGKTFSFLSELFLVITNGNQPIPSWPGRLKEVISCGIVRIWDQKLVYAAFDYLMDNLQEG